MSDVLLIIAGIALLLIPIALIAVIVQILRKKPKKKVIALLLGLLGVFIVFESIGVATMCKHEWVVDEENVPTCTDAGNRIFHCNICDKRKTEKIKHLGHDLSIASRVESTVQSEGSETYICSRCGYQEIKKLSKKDCNHEWSDATCVVKKTCMVCGKTEGNFAEHLWESATCTESAICKVCGEISGSLAEHVWIEATCKAPKTCSLCGTTQGELAEHTWQAATETSPKTCSTCGITQGKPLAEITKPSQETTSPSNKETNSTSDTSFARHTEDESWICAKKIVKDSLKSPSSAKFCSMSEATITHEGNGKYSVSGWVEAQNSYGAVLRQTFIVTYTATANGYKNANVTLF